MCYSDIVLHLRHPILQHVFKWCVYVGAAGLQSVQQNEGEEFMQNFSWVTS
jgi:hypothetical protein